MLKKTVSMAILIGFSVSTMVSCVGEQYQQRPGAVVGGGSGAVAGGALGG